MTGGRHLAISCTPVEETAPSDPDATESADPYRIGVPARTDPGGAPPVRELERYLLENTDGSATHLRAGSSVTVPLDEAECQRARIALRQVSLDGTVTQRIGVAAIALEVSLEVPQGRARDRDGPVTLELDVAECVLMALALLYTCRQGERDDYRRQARSLLDRADRSTPDSVAVPTPDV